MVTHGPDGHTHDHEFVIPETPIEVIEEYLASLPEGEPVIPTTTAAPTTTQGAAVPETTTTVAPVPAYKPRQERFW